MGTESMRVCEGLEWPLKGREEGAYSEYTIRGLHGLGSTDENA